MPDTRRSNLTRRRYRLAQAVTVAGLLAVGSLVVSRLVRFFRDDFFLFYGVSDVEYRVLQENAASNLPFTIGKLMVAALALVAVCAFIWTERRRLRQADEFGTLVRHRRRELVVERLSLGSWFDAFVLRTSAFAGLLLSMWLLQSSLERRLGGFGWGLEYADWRSLLPLVSVFGVCVLVGTLVSAMSLVGTRAIHVLELVLGRIARRRRRNVSVSFRCRRQPARVRTIRELIGCDILSRPPPLAC